jgi:5-methylcytosine-specific restriction endonuclease McrA
MKCENCNKEFEKKRPHNAGRFCCLDCCLEFRKKSGQEKALDGKTNQRRWYERNKEKAAKQHAEYKEKNGDAIKKYKTAWYKENRNSILEYQKAKRRDMTEEEKEMRRIKARQWKKDNPELMRASDKRQRQTPHGKARLFFNNNKRRLGGSMLNSKMIEDWIDSQKIAGILKCAYCKKNCSEKYEIDHYIPLAKGGSNNLDNFRIACPKCNRLKSATHPERFTCLTPPQTA